ncbi:hypothetical protein FSP39_003498, partial [Pinctada imbricata]
FDVPELHDAVFRQNFNLVKRLVAERHNLNISISSPKFMKQRKDNITYMAGFFRGATPLMVACHTGNLRIVCLLVEKGAIVNKTDSIGVTPFAIACARNHLPVCKYLRRRGALTEIRDDLFGMTPLHVACRMGHTSLAKWLSAHGSNVHACDFTGKSTMHFAAWSYNIELIKFLVSKNVSLNSKDKNGDTPLHYIVSNHDLVPDHIEKHFCACEYETAAAIIDQISTIEQYQLSISIHREEDREMGTCKSTDIWYAAETMLKSGANPNAVNYKEETPLHLLASCLPASYLTRGYVITFETKVNQEMLVLMLILLKMGAEPEKLTKLGKSATALCLEQYNQLAAKILNRYMDVCTTVSVEDHDVCTAFIQRYGARYLQKEKQFERQLEQISDTVIEPQRRRSVVQVCREAMRSVNRYIQEVIVG